MTKGHNFNYTQIEKRANDFNAEIVEFGPNIIGEHIIMAKDPQDNVATYVLTGVQGNAYKYECIYSDY